jgi:hypothetical protein
MRGSRFTGQQRLGLAGRPGDAGGRGAAARRGSTSRGFTAGGKSMGAEVLREKAVQANGKGKARRRRLVADLGGNPPTL